MGEAGKRRGTVEAQLKLNILDNNRKDILPLLKEFKDKFYLAGGTALALQLGHRISVDFDFFAIDDFNLDDMQKINDRLFKKHKLNAIQMEPGTYTILIDDEIKLSFFKIEHKTIKPFKESEWFKLCSEVEIGAIKISALLRAAFRDYVDIYFLLKKYSLEEIINLCLKKYPSFEVSVYLKALLSYDDIEIVPIKYAPGFETKPEEVFSFIENQTKTYIAKHI